MTEDGKGNRTEMPSNEELERAYDEAGFAAARQLWNGYLSTIGVEPLPTCRREVYAGVEGEHGFCTVGDIYKALGI